MGQRSQIYIRYNVNGNEGLIARYYQWNYGERMISRARYIIQTIKDKYLDYGFMFEMPDYIEKLTRICDVNFDKKDIVMSRDIIKEVKEEWDNDISYLFNQDNNDGQLFIDVSENGIKYCFVQFYNEGLPMNGEQYMKWNCENEEKLNWHIPDVYMTKETISYTKKNIKAISSMAQLMTEKELKEFIEFDYIKYIK